MPISVACRGIPKCALSSLQRGVDGLELHGQGHYSPLWQGHSFNEQEPDLYGKMDPHSDLTYNRTGMTQRRASDANKAVFPCSICGKEFSRPDYRRQHKESIHDKVTCRCVCGKVYTFTQNLQRHQKNCFLHLSMQH